MISLSDVDLKLYDIPYGVQRRLRILNLMRTDKDTYGTGKIPVNGMYQPRLENDPDLMHLVKKGKLRIVRDPAGRARQTRKAVAEGHPYPAMKIEVKSRWLTRGQTWLVLGKSKGK
jgi:hypothetical protein